MTFAERLKTIRKDCNMTQRDVYSILNISPNGYASYEQGRTEPNIEMIKRLCKIFDVSADYLLGMDSFEYNETRSSEE
ncbi:helix-turn-helix domain-containing protein [Anaerocaecibacter muris]|uniref:helix-turn-helix domain-containing protein n=1 Tax=Anaerocaecibacter muris TaxID=2941513 RepID=UPI003B849665